MRRIAGSLHRATDRAMTYGRMAIRPMARAFVMAADTTAILICQKMPCRFNNAKLKHGVSLFMHDQIPFLYSDEIVLLGVVILIIIGFLWLIVSLLKR